MPSSRRTRRGTAAGKEGAVAAPSSSPVEIAIRYVGSRRRFEREVRTHLKRKGVAAGDAETAIDRLKELSLVADSETARAWIRDRMNLAPRGRGLLRRELLSKGVGSEVVDEALEDLVPEADESAAAVEFLRKGAYKWRGLAEGVARKRMWSALARRGFPSSVCRDALTQFAEQQDFDAADTA